MTKLSDLASTIRSKLWRITGFEIRLIPLRPGAQNVVAAEVGS